MIEWIIDLTTERLRGLKRSAARRNGRECPASDASSGQVFGGRQCHARHEVEAPLHFKIEFKQPQGASADDGNTGKKQDDEDDGQNKE